MANILLIEDNDDMRENTSEILSLAGHHVETASNGKEGVIKAQLKTPELIICDIMMPELDGYGVLHMLNRDPNTNHIPFIFLTAKADRADVRKGMELGADDYVTKPFDDVELLSAVDTRLKKSSLMQSHNFSNGPEGFENFIKQVKTIEEFTKIDINNKTKTYKKKDIIYSESNTPLYLFYIEKGKVKTVKNNKQDKPKNIKLGQVRITKENYDKLPKPTPPKNIIGHALVAVGYDDNLEFYLDLDSSEKDGYNLDLTKEPIKGGFLFRDSRVLIDSQGNELRDSQGKKLAWGDNGYGWIPYEYVEKGLATDWWSLLNAEWINTSGFGIATDQILGQNSVGGRP